MIDISHLDTGTRFLISFLVGFAPGGIGKMAADYFMEAGKKVVPEKLAKNDLRGALFFAFLPLVVFFTFLGVFVYTWMTMKGEVWMVPWIGWEIGIAWQSINDKFDKWRKNRRKKVAARGPLFRRKIVVSHI